jgi:uncharacterized phage protein gp47/JayE
MQLSLQTFNNMVQSMAAAVQSAATQIVDLTVGSTLRAILEANASIALWMQWLILQVLQMTRAATSNGADLDSWMADFSLSRLPATPAAGVVTLTRFNTGLGGTIPVGALVRTADGSQTFAVYEDASLPAWDPVQGCYLLNQADASIDVPVRAQIAGTSGNVQVASITVISSALSGIDVVSNGSTFENGIDEESDAALRERFQAYMASRARATLTSISYAIASVQQGLSSVILENQDSTGAWQPGNFHIVVDDGSGYPSSGLLASVQVAVSAVRPVGSTFSVSAPHVVVANVQFTVALTGNADLTSLTPSLSDAANRYINALAIADQLPASRIAQVIYSAFPQVTNVTNILINGQASDLIVPATGLARAGIVTVN